MESLQDFVSNLSERRPKIAGAQFLATTGSTNVEAVRLAREGAPDGTLIVADRQTEGKGRRGRSWESSPGKGLYFSLLVRPKLKAEITPLLTLAGGLALGNVLRQYGVTDLVIKWPNDIWVNNKKIAGILSESTAQGNETQFVVLGIGVNVSHQAEDFSPEIRDKASSLKMILSREISRSQLLSDLLPKLYEEIDLLSSEGPEALVKRWTESSGMIGRQVTATLNGEEKEGRVTGLTSEGHLLIQSQEETLALIDEDVMLA